MEVTNLSSAIIHKMLQHPSTWSPEECQELVGLGYCRENDERETELTDCGRRFCQAVEILQQVDVFVYNPVMRSEVKKFLNAREGNPYGDI